MKKIYLECNMGVSGDMLCGALLDTLNENDKINIIKKLNTLMDGVEVSASGSKKCGISGTKFDVHIIKQGHHHTSLNEIYEIINGFELNERVKQNAKEIYRLIANAESKIHGTEIADIHLHEVGAKDAIMDITACCYILEYIGECEIVCSPIVVGYGEIETEHGILPIPAPATAELLKGIETKTGDINGELATPTGAGLIKYFAKEITLNKPDKFEKIGYGMGTKDFKRANCLRVFISENDSNYENIIELKCQIDDMTGEEMGYAINKLISLGALDAFIAPITMKKSRPAFALTVLAYPEKKDYFIKQIFKHTTTLGIREIKCKRSILSREIIENSVSIKKSEGFGVKKEKLEFDELARLADERDISIFEARSLVK